MNQFDDFDATKPQKCPICKGTGFYKGEFCICITGESDMLHDDDTVNFLKGIFGMKDKK